MTVINREAATKRFHQGLYFLLGMSKGGREPVDADTFLAVITVMAYLGAYVFPDENLSGLKKRLIATLDAFSEQADVETIVDRRSG